MRWLRALILTMALLGSPARIEAQGVPGDPTAEERPAKVPALQYTIALLLTILILVIVCVPSRKPVQSD
jgi:hypothetical protein